jgi:hypothetical protein
VAGAGVFVVCGSFPVANSGLPVTWCACAEKRSRFVKGHSKKKVTDLGVVGWFLGGQKSTRVGHIFFRDFFIVFLNSPHRETPKNVIKKNREKIGFGFFCRLF